MKTNLLSAAVVSLLFLLSVGCQTADLSEPVDDGHVAITFDHPENFTDFKDGPIGTDRGREDYEYTLRRSIREDVSRLLKPGQKLSIVFTDIDLAGDFIPPVSVRNDIRVIKRIYPPRMKLHFTLTDAAGNVLKEGDRELRDLTFMDSISAADRQGDLAYDRVMLRNWLRQELR